MLFRSVGDEIVGYAVLRQAEFAGIRSGLICDLLVEAGERGQDAGLLLTARAMKQFKAAGLALAGSLILKHTEEYRVLRRAGFVPCPKRLAPQDFQLVVRPTGDNLTREYMAETTHWFLTMADHDAV